MSMDMSGAGGVFSVPEDHIPGPVVLVAAPLVAWLAVCGCQALGRHVGWAAMWSRRLEEMPLAGRAALFASYVGAIVHAVLVQPHWGEDRTRATLFVFDAIGFGVAFAWTFSMRRGWRLVTLTMMGATVGSYAFYVLRGWEDVDLVGLITTTIELAVALILVAPPQPAIASTRSRERWIGAVSIPLALVSVLGTGAIASATQDASADASPVVPSGGHPGHGMAGMAGMSMGGGKAFSVATTSPAGPITWPVSMATMGPGMKMATPPCTTRPTTAQQNAAVTLVNRTVQAVARYQSLAVAKAAGYVPVTPTGLPVVHYINPSIYRQGPLLDPNSIPVLVYANTAHGAVLTAAMYLMPLTSAGRKPPQPGGCLTQWHIHTNLCFADGAVVATTQAGSCPANSINVPTRPMMHVWLAPVPGGPLATDPTTPSQLAAAARLPRLKTPNGTA